MSHGLRLITIGVVASALLAIMPGRAEAGKRYLWVTNAYGNDVHVFTVPEHELVRRIEVGPEPHGIASPDDASVIYVSIEDFEAPQGELLWIDPRTYEITHRLTIGPEPNQIACTPDGKFIYVPCKDGQYWVIDGHQKKVVTKIRTGGRPHNTQASRDGKLMYLSPMGSPKRVTIVDLHDGHKVIGEIPFDNVVRPPALAPDGKRIYQQIDGLLGFQVADTTSRTVFATVPHNIREEFRTIGSRCHGLAIRPDQKEIWSCNLNHKIVHIHDITTDEFPEIGQVPMIDHIYWLCFSPDSKYAYISIRGASKIAVVDTHTKKVLKHLSVGDTPKRSIVITFADE